MKGLATLESADGVTLEPRAAADAAVIWLHGLGADGYDFVPVVDALGLDAGHRIRFVFPHAPVRPVTLNMGMPMRAWYDIHALTLNAPDDSAGLDASVQRVQGLLDAQRSAGIAAERIVLAGFSQGGAVAIHSALGLDWSLGGLMLLSTYLPQVARLQARLTAAGRAIAVQMHHGRSDDILPLALGEWSRDQLRALGLGVDWHVWPMPHAVCDEQLQVVGSWLRARLG